MVKVLTVPGKDRILGATIVGEHAGELIVEFVSAMKHGIGLNKILGTIHIYPDARRGEQVRRRGLEEGARARAPPAGARALSRVEARLKLSIVIPALNEAEHIGAALQALAPLRRRGYEVIVVDGGSADGTRELAEPLCDRVVSSARGRATADERRGAPRDGRRAAFPARRYAPAPEVTLASGSLKQSLWGRFDVEIESRHRLLRLVAWAMNLRSRLSGIATGDQAIFVRREAFPGFPAIALMEDIAFSRRDEAARRAGLPARAGAHLGPALGKARCAAHRCPHVAPAPALLLRVHHPSGLRDSTNLDSAVLVFSPRPGARAGEDASRPRLGEWRAARLHARLTRHAMRTARPARVRPGRALSTRRSSAARTSASACIARWRALRNHRGAIVIGADCPALTAARPAARGALLAGGCDVVLAPAEDGGYALIAARRVSPPAFHSIAWGGSDGLRDNSAKTRFAGIPLALARAGLGRRPARGPGAAQMAPLCFSRSATRSAMTR